MSVRSARSHRAVSLVLMALLLVQTFSMLAPNARAQSCAPRHVISPEFAPGIGTGLSSFVAIPGQSVAFLVQEVASNCHVTNYDETQAWSGPFGAHVGFCFDDTTRAVYDCANAQGCSATQACVDGILMPNVSDGITARNDFLLQQKNVMGQSFGLHTFDSTQPVCPPGSGDPADCAQIPFVAALPPYSAIDVYCAAREVQTASIDCGRVQSWDLAYVTSAQQAITLAIRGFWEPDLSAFGADLRVMKTLHPEWFGQVATLNVLLEQLPPAVVAASADTHVDGVLVNLTAPPVLGESPRGDGEVSQIELARLDPNPAPLATFYYDPHNYGSLYTAGGPTSTVSFLDADMVGSSRATYAATVRTDIGATTTTFSSGCDPNNLQASHDCCKSADTFQQSCCDAYTETYEFCCEWAPSTESCHCDAPRTLTTEWTIAPGGAQGVVRDEPIFPVVADTWVQFLIDRIDHTVCGPIDTGAGAMASWTGAPGTHVAFCYDKDAQAPFDCADASACDPAVALCMAGVIVPDRDAAYWEFEDLIGQPLTLQGDAISLATDVPLHTSTLDYVPVIPTDFASGAIDCSLESGPHQGADCGSFDAATQTFTTAAPGAGGSFHLLGAFQADYGRYGFSQATMDKFDLIAARPVAGDLHVRLVHAPAALSRLDAEVLRHNKIALRLEAPPMLGVLPDADCANVQLSVDRLFPNPTSLVTLPVCEDGFLVDGAPQAALDVADDDAPVGADITYATSLRNGFGESRTELTVSTPTVDTPDPVSLDRAGASTTPGIVSVTLSSALDTSGAPITRFHVDRMRAGFADKSLNLTPIGGSALASANGVGNNALVKFRVRGANFVGDGAWTYLNDTSMTTIPPPTRFTASFQAGDGSIALSWQAWFSFDFIHYGAYDHFRIDRATSLAGPWRLVAELPFTEDYQDASFHAGEPRIYRIAAYNAAGRGAYAFANVTDAPTAAPPAPPTEKTCAVKTSNGWVCTSGESSPVTGIAASGSHSCVVLADHNADCWGADRSGESQDMLTHAAASVWAGPSTTCIILQTRDLECYGSNIAGAANPRVHGDAESIALGAMHGCTLVDGGNAVCAGLSDSGAAQSRLSADVTQVAAGLWHTCFLLTSGNVACQGDDTYGQLFQYEGGDAVKVVAGSYHTCILTSGGAVTCVGLNSQHQADGFARGAIDVAAGAYFTCAIIGVSGGVRDVTCTGDNSGGQAANYLGGDAVALAAGERHLCILTDSGRAECQGSGIGFSDAGQGTSYPSQKDPTSVANLSAPPTPPATPPAPALAGMIALGALVVAPVTRGRGRALLAALLLGIIPVAGAQVQAPALPVAGPIVLGTTIGPGQTENLSAGSFLVTGLLDVAAGGLLIVGQANLDFANGAGILVENGGRLQVADSTLASSSQATTNVAIPLTLAAGSAATIERSFLNGTALVVGTSDARLDRIVVNGALATVTLHESDAVLSRSRIEGLPVGLRIEGGAPQILDLTILDASTCVEDIGSTARYHGDILDGCREGMLLDGSHVSAKLVALVGAGTGTGLNLTNGASIDLANDSIQGWDVGISDFGGLPLDPSDLLLLANGLDVAAPAPGEFPESLPTPLPEPTDVFHTDYYTLARYPFNGDVNDASGNGRDLHAVYEPATFTTCCRGEALAVGPDTLQQGLDWRFQQHFLDGAFTIEMLLVPHSSVGTTELMRPDQYGIETWVIQDGAFRSLPTGAPMGSLSPNAYHYLALVGDGSPRMEVYLDGADLGSTPTGFDGFTAPKFFRGFADDASVHVDEMRVSNITRTAAQISGVEATLGHLPAAPPAPARTNAFHTDAATLARFEFNGDSRDRSGNGRDLDNNGGLSFSDACCRGQALDADGASGLDWHQPELLAHPFTIEMVLETTATGTVPLFAQDAASEAGWYLEDGAFRVDPDGAPLCAGFAPGAPHYLALVSETDADMRVYEDGVDCGVTPKGFTGAPIAATFFANAARAADGHLLVDGMRISSISRSADEIATVQADLQS